MKKSKRVFTQSEFKCWQRCGRKWWLSYYRRLRLKRFKPTAASQGTLFHIALEAHGKGLSWREALEAQANADKDRSEEMYHDDLDAQHDLAFIMVEGYIEWADAEGVNAHSNLLASEVKIERDMGEWILRGKLDELRENDETGGVWFRDFKTGDFNTIVKGADLNSQFAIYQIILEGPDGTNKAPIDGGQFVVAKKVKRKTLTKGGAYGEHRVKYNSAQIAATRAKIEVLAAQIMAAEDAIRVGDGKADQIALTNPTNDCNWDCDFRSVCPMFDNGSDIEAALADYYEQQDPMERYSK